MTTIKTPTFLLKGEISKVLSQEAATTMVQAMTNCTLEVIEGAGHSVQSDQPAAFAAALDAFLIQRLTR